jgi:hypothetical protein
LTFPSAISSALARFRRPLLAGLALAALVGGGSLLFPNTYLSEVVIFPKGPAAGPLAALANTVAMFAGGGLGQLDEDAHYVDLVKSRWVAERLLDSEYEFVYRSWRFGRPQARRETLNRFLEVATPEDREDAIATVQEWVGGVKDVKSGLLRISAEAPSQELAQQLAQHATEELHAAVKARAQTQGLARAAYAKGIAEEALMDEERARLALDDFARAHVNFVNSPDPTLRTRGESLMAEMALRRLVRTNLTLAFEQADLEANSTTPVFNVFAPAYRPLVKAGPGRGQWVLMGLLAGFAAVACWERREGIKRMLAGSSGQKRPEASRLAD